MSYPTPTLRDTRSLHSGLRVSDALLKNEPGTHGAQERLQEYVVGGRGKLLAASRLMRRHRRGQLHTWCGRLLLICVNT